MVNTLQIVSIVITVGTTILFSGLFSAELFIQYQIVTKEFDNSTIIDIRNIGLIQAKDAILYITSKQPDKITENCLEGQLIQSTRNQNITQIAFDRISTGVDCIIDLHGINKDNVYDIVITSDNKSAYRPDSYVILIFYAYLVGLILFELVGLWKAIPFLVDDTLPAFFSLKYKKDQNSKDIQTKIKSEFGMKLYLIDIEIMKKIYSKKITILQISSQLKLFRFIVKRRLRYLTKLELMNEERDLNKYIVEIINSNLYY